jgi:hypothetical protein
VTDQAKELSEIARRVTIYLVAVLLASFLLGYVLLIFLGITSPLRRFFIESIIGFSGSAVAALTSCIDRYARGFELDDGRKEPEDAKGETFNRRMARAFYVRPFLGFVAAPVLMWGFELFGRNPKELDSPERLAFMAFLGGLLAKSVFELIKGLFKNIFKA